MAKRAKAPRPAAAASGEDASEVRGYLYTHADCPHCGKAQEFEGDMAAEEVTCERCEKDFNIGTVG